jgi:hypothetical protein
MLSWPLSVVRHGQGWAVKFGDDFIGVTRRREDADAALAILMSNLEPSADGTRPQAAPNAPSEPPVLDAA